MLSIISFSPPHAVANRSPFHYGGKDVATGAVVPATKVEGNCTVCPSRPRDGSGFYRICRQLTKGIIYLGDYFFLLFDHYLPHVRIYLTIWTWKMHDSTVVSNSSFRPCPLPLQAHAWRKVEFHFTGCPYPLALSDNGMLIYLVGIADRQASLSVPCPEEGTACLKKIMESDIWRATWISMVDLYGAGRV